MQSSFRLEGLDPCWQGGLLALGFSSSLALNMIKVAQRDLWIYSAIFVDILSIFTHILLKNPRYLEKSCTKKEDKIFFLAYVNEIC